MTLMILMQMQQVAEDGTWPFQLLQPRGCHFLSRLSWLRTCWHRPVHLPVFIPCRKPRSHPEIREFGSIWLTFTIFCQSSRQLLSLIFCDFTRRGCTLNVLKPRGITMPMPWPFCPGREHAERAAERGTGGWPCGPCGPCAVASPKARCRDEKFPQFEMMENHGKPLENQ